MDHAVLEMNKISKSFPGVQALDSVDFDLKPGEVHVLMGENGAGKSTLMKILGGLYQEDGGQILLSGEIVRFQSPSEALQNGISMIYQELNPIPYMTVAENIFLGREPKLTKLGFLNHSKLNNDAKSILEELGIDINPKRLMHELSVAETQMVEIAKAISYHSRIIIMDEPTSAITDREIDILFDFIEKLKKQDIAIVYISHKLDEIFRIADRITVLRDGQLVGCYKADEINKEKLIALMVGREIQDVYPKRVSDIGDVLFEVRNLSKSGLFHDISFSLKKGEVLGISGLMGAGRTEVVETIFGIRRADSGEVYINGESVRIKGPQDAISNGVSLISEDRKNSGLNLKGSVRENISILELKKLSTLGFVNTRKEIAEVKKWSDALQIKTPSYEQLTNYLSGGNQQKVVIAKWLTVAPNIIIMDEPTRGIDVGAKREIYDIISDLAQQGKGIIVISSELPEIMGMCDRVLIMHDGAITGELDKGDFDQEVIMRYATGYDTRKGN